MSGERVRIWLLGSIEVSRRNQDGTWSLVDREAFGKPKHGRSVLKRLLATPGRRLPRGQIQDDLWPEIDMSLADSYLYNAIAKVRAAIGRELVSTNDAIYEIAGQPLVWTDIDQVDALMCQIENQGHLSAGAIALLEEALSYLTRGPALEGEDGTWCYAPRRKAEDALRQCRLWLAEAYAAQGKYWQASEQYRALLQVMPPDEDALYAWLQMLVRQGKANAARDRYRDIVHLADLQGYVLSTEAKTRLADLLVSSAARRQVTAGGILPLHHTIEEQDHDMLRRQFLLGGFLAAGLLPFMHADASLLLHLLRPSGSRPLPVDDALIELYEQRTEHYWQTRHAVTFDASDLWKYLMSHLQKSLALLEGSLQPGQRKRLCAIVSKTAQLAGVTVYDEGHQRAARSWHQIAIQAAQEAEQPELAATAGGWLTFTWMYTKDYASALQSIEQAIVFARQTPDQLLVAWLKAIESEIQVHLGQQSACLAALQQAETLVDASPLSDHLSLFNLNHTQLLGYKGVCFQQLYRKDDPGTHSFLLEAREALASAVDSPTSVRRRITYLHDLAGVYAREGEVEAACAVITRSFPLLGDVGTKTMIRRLADTRALLEPAAQSASVRALDEQLAMLLGLVR